MDSCLRLCMAVARTICSGGCDPAPMASLSSALAEVLYGRSGPVAPVGRTSKELSEVALWLSRSLPGQQSIQRHALGAR